MRDKRVRERATKLSRLEYIESGELTINVRNIKLHRALWDYHLKLEVQGATAPLLLAPAEGWRGPSGPAGSLWLPLK